MRAMYLLQFSKNWWSLLFESDVFLAVKKEWGSR